MITPLVIVGTTSSGKTSLALRLAEQFGNVDILTVDSKQVYTHQDIVTGKDLPDAFKPVHAPIQHYSDGTTRIFGIDLVAPNGEWSIAHFLSYAKAVKDLSSKEERQLIIVGGTPLYTRALFQAPETAAVPPDTILRETLEKESVVVLQKRLKKLHASRFMRMNESDRVNPRRLIRAIEIEIAHSLEENIRAPEQKKEPLFLTLFTKEHSCWIGLKLDPKVLAERISQRVDHRLLHGAIQEYQDLQSSYPDWRPEAKSALGYFEIETYLSTGKDKKKLRDMWTLHEIQYAKRQMQWWKREPQILWYSANDETVKDQVLQQLKACYNQTI